MELWLGIHIVGALLGVGVVSLNDGLMLRALWKPTTSPAYQRVSPILSGLIWLALLLLATSGIALYLARPDTLAGDPKFLAKMSIVGILTLNGIYLNVVGHPALQSLTATDWIERSPKLRTMIAKLEIAGMISLVGWYSAFLLGALRDLTVSLPLLLGLFVLAVALITLCSRPLVRRLLH